MGVGTPNNGLYEQFNVYNFNSEVSSSLAYNTTNRAVTFLTPNAPASYGISSVYDDKLTFGRFNVSGTANGYGFVCGVNGDFTLNADYYSGNSAIDFIYKATTRNIGIRTVSPTAALHVSGQDSTSSNYALKVDNSASSPLLYVRNDGNVYAYGIGSISSNTFFGLDNLLSNTTGDYNSVYGVDAMRSNTIGRINIAIGHSAMRNITGASDYNVAIGFQALMSLTASTSSVAVGFQSLMAATTGSQNTAVGHQSLKSITTGYNNNAFGHSALLNNIVGLSNSAFGTEALKNTNSDNNTAIGAAAGRDNVSGTGNVFTYDYPDSRYRSSTKNSIHLITRCYKIMRNQLYNIGFDSFKMLYDDKNINIKRYNPPYKLGDNALLFDKGKMNEWYNLGYNS